MRLPCGPALSHAIFAFALALVAGCANAPDKPVVEGGRALPVARLGERIHVDGPELTPLAVLEDSRCPRDVDCVQAGTVRLRVQIHLGSGTTTRDLSLGEPIQVADGALVLAFVAPDPVGGSPVAPAEYRFGFRFDGGL